MSKRKFNDGDFVCLTKAAAQCIKDDAKKTKYRNIQNKKL